MSTSWKDDSKLLIRRQLLGNWRARGPLKLSFDSLSDIRLVRIVPITSEGRRPLVLLEYMSSAVRDDFYHGCELTCTLVTLQDMFAIRIRDPLLVSGENMGVQGLQQPCQLGWHIM